MDKKTENSEEYLNSILSKETGFSLPKSYFENFDNEIETRLFEEKNLLKNNFKTPNNYFEKLEDTIISKVKSPNKDVKVISLKERFLKVIPFAAAASVILFIGLNSFYFNKTQELTLDSLSDNDIEFWLDSNALNSNDISYVFQDNILDENELNFATIEDKNIEDYIHFINDDSLLNELN